MPVKPAAFLETAALLVISGTEECDFRSAVSRAYYAAFHAVKWKTSGAVVYSGGNEHSIALNHVTNRWLEDLARDFTTLQDRRIEADYYLDESVSKGRAEFLLKKARRFVEHVYTKSVT